MIDTSTWKAFRVGDYFHGVRGTSRKMQELNEGEIPVIAAARYNQGIAGYYDVPSEYENAITISCNGVGCGSTYYHDYPFAITGDAIVLENIGNVPIGALHFIASVYDVYFSRKYSYTDKCSADKVEAEYVSLPATSDDQPDWDYMESYMKAVMEESEKSLENLKKADDTKHLIDVSGWGEFRVGDYFEVTYGTFKAKSESVDEGGVPHITTTQYNNGIGYYVKEQMFPAHCITVASDGCQGASFYHTYPISASNIVSVCVSHDDVPMNEIIGNFLCSLFRKEGEKYSWGGFKYSVDRVRETRLHLPATLDGQPDWDYMESYMKAVMEESEKSLENLKKADDTKHLIDVSGWKRFHLYDDGMFGIDMGTKMDKAKMKEVHPTINFVGRANANNGITTCVDRIDDIEPYPSGYMTLSLGGEYLGSCFIQPKPFYTSQNVIVLIPNDNMTDNVKRFIATMVFRESRSKYKAFVDELNRHIKTDFSILLPITSTGEPDWQYMEDYMSSIMDKSEQIISDLQIGA